MTRHLAIADKLGALVYFCDSRSPWQRGSNDNTNGLLRDYFPKGVTLVNHPPEYLRAVEEELKHRPRVVLQDRCPADLLAALLAVRQSVAVAATLTGTHLAARWSVFSRRRHTSPSASRPAAHQPARCSATVTITPARSTDNRYQPQVGINHLDSPHAELDETTAGLVPRLGYQN
jgi:IS30 family transposase